jgi:COMPASS component SWD3
MRSLPAHSDPVGGVDFLRDGTMVVSCAGDGLIRIWDAGTGQCLKTLVDEDRKAVTAVKFSPNGKFVLAWTLDNSIRLWNYIEGRCVKTYQGHANSQFSLSGVLGSYVYDLGGQLDDDVGARKRLEAFVASGSEDGDVLAWDVSSKDILWRGKGHRDVVLSLDFGRTRDGKGLLVSGGKDRDLRLWRFESDESDAEFFGHDVHDEHDEAVADGHDGMDVDLDDVVEGPSTYGNGSAHEVANGQQLVDGDVDRGDQPQRNSG